MTRKEWELRRMRYEHAMKQIAREAGKEAKITKAMGSVAWGRYPHESSPGQTAYGVAQGLGYIEGVRDAIMRVGQMEGWPGTHLLERIYDRINKEDATARNKKPNAGNH